MKRVCAYCRVSTGSEEQENSFENQKSYFKHFVEAAGHRLISIYADQGISGTKLSRPEFNKMLYDAGINVIVMKPSDTAKIQRTHVVYEKAVDRKPLFDEIWVKNMSRFARNTLSKEIIIELREQGVNVHAVEGNVDTIGVTNDVWIGIIQLFDEQESRDKSQRTLTGIKETARKGGMRSNSKLYGYRYLVGKNSLESKLEVIAEEAKVVRRIFKMYAAGKGIRTIINALTDDGILTRKGKPFGKTTIRNILDNEKYAGLNNKLKYDTGIILRNKHRPKRKEQYDVEPCDRIQPIITPELFYKCQRVLKSKIDTKRDKGCYAGNSRYAGLLRCGLCGSHYVGNSNNGYRFYNCTTKRATASKKCTGKNVSMKALDEMFDWFKENPQMDIPLMRQKEKIHLALCGRMAAILEELDQDSDALAEEIERKIEECKFLRSKYQEFYIMARNPEQQEQYRKIIDQTLEKEDMLQKEYEEVTRSNEDRYRELDALRKSCDELSSIEVGMKTITRESVNTIVVDPDGETLEKLQNDPFYLEHGRFYLELNSEEITGRFLENIYGKRVLDLNGVESEAVMFRVKAIPHKTTRKAT